MPYKLTYFDLRARAETSRMLFALAEVDYEDKRVNKEEWEKLKPVSPFGQLPILDVDGQQFCQSRAIERFLAKRFGLNGKNEFECAKADMLADCLEDVFKHLVKIFSEQNAEEKEKLKTKFIEDATTMFLPRFEDMVTSEGGFLGDQVTWPDLVFFNGWTWPAIMGVAIDLEKFPKLKGVCKRVETNPKIAAWLKKRPDNSM